MLVHHLKAHPAAFDPEDVRLLTTAFDKAWETVRSSGANFDDNNHAETARTVIAKHIIEAALRGERDQRRLRDGAVIAYTQENLRATATRLVRARRRASLE